MFGFTDFASKPRPEIYFPHVQKPYLVLNIAVRTKEDPRLLVGSVREVFRRLDPQKPAHNITPLEDLVDATVIRDRYAMTLGVVLRCGCRSVGASCDLRSACIVRSTGPVLPRKSESEWLSVRVKVRSHDGLPDKVCF